MSSSRVVMPQTKGRALRRLRYVVRVCVSSSYDFPMISGFMESRTTRNSSSLSVPDSPTIETFAVTIPIDIIFPPGIRIIDCTPGACGYFELVIVRLDLRHIICTRRSSITEGPVSYRISIDGYINRIWYSRTYFKGVIE